MSTKVTLNAGYRPTVLQYLQRLAGRVIRWAHPRGVLWWDVSTWSRRGHRCASCGRVSHTERVHITHDCERAR